MHVYELPLAGRIGIEATERGISRIDFAPKGDGPATALTEKAAAQLREFFEGTRSAFDLPLDPAGTPFQRATWVAVSQVPYGRTATYRDIALRIGAPDATRAVGAANGANPLPFVVPCHRVVGSDGRLTGYAGGVDLKERLLRLEGAFAVGRRDVHLIGARSTRIYCRPTCRYGARLSRVPAIFDSVEEARADGYRACKVCRP